MKYLITFAYGNNVECLVDVSYKAITKYVVNMDSIKFHYEIIETNDNKNLNTMIEELRLSLFNNNDWLPDWIRLVGITPIINSELEEVIYNSDMMYLDLNLFDNGK